MLVGGCQQTDQSLDIDLLTHFLSMPRLRGRLGFNKSDSNSINNLMLGSYR